MRNNKVHAIEVVEAASFPKNEVEDDRPSEEEEKKGTEATAEVTDENQGTVGLEHQYVKLLSEYCHRKNTVNSLMEAAATIKNPKFHLDTAASIQERLLINFLKIF